jgi:oligoendopeptidase F
LQLGGVDMTTDQPVNDVVALFASQLDEVERLLAEE